MNEITEMKMTTRQVANYLGTSSKVVLTNARKCLPNKVIENGKTTYWSNEEVTILLDYIKENSHRTDTAFTKLVKVTETTLTPALKIKKAFELMQEGYEEELSRLRQENIEQKQKLLEQKEDVEFSKLVQADEKSCFTMSQVAQELKLPYGNIGLFRKLRELKILKNDNCPYQQYVDMGLFKVYPKIISVKDTTKTVLVTLATQKRCCFYKCKIKIKRCVMSKELKLEIVERLLRRGEIPSAVVMSYEWRISKKKFQELCKKTGVVDGV